MKRPTKTSTNNCHHPLTDEVLRVVSGGETWGEWCQDRWDDAVEAVTGQRGGIRTVSDTIGG